MLDYATADSEVRRVLEERIAQMESKAAKLQVGGAGRRPGRAGQELARCWQHAGAQGAQPISCSVCLEICSRQTEK